MCDRVWIATEGICARTLIHAVWIRVWIQGWKRKKKRHCSHEKQEWRGIKEIGKTQRQAGGGGMRCESGNKCLALCVLMYCSRSRRRWAFMARDWQVDELWISLQNGFWPAVRVCLHTCMFHYGAAIHLLLTRTCHRGSVWEKKKRLNFNPAYGREENSDNPRLAVGIEGLGCIRIIWGGGFS